MVIRAVVCLVATAAFVWPVKADHISTVIEQFGLLGSWADDCAGYLGNLRQGFSLVIAGPPGAAPTYTTVNIDNGVKTTIHSVIVSAIAVSPRRLGLRLRITGGDVDGGPLPSPTTNTFEQTFEKLADDGVEMTGNPPVRLKRCRI
jgi:hypothetical protein